MNFNKMIEADRVINASSYRYRCSNCKKVIGYDGFCSNKCEKEHEEYLNALDSELGY
jgi:rRNA maturation endonuclease Nob1